MGKSIVEEVKDSIKNKQKKETSMKNIKNNSTVKTITTVTITLACIAALAGSFLAGMNYQKGVNDEVTNQIKSVVSAIKVETPKENQ